MKVFLSILLFLTIVSSGCYSIETVESTKISSADVYQSYSIRADKNHTSVTATFRVGSKSGATIDLDAPSKIEDNGKLIPEIAPSGWKGTTYENSANKFIGQHQFVYTDGGGKIFSNEINFAPLEFKADSFKISRRSNKLIPLSRVVDKNEEVSVEVSGKTKPNKTNSNADVSNTVLVRLDPTRSAVLIEPNDLKNFLDGKVSVSLRAERTNPLEQKGTKGGEISFFYEAEQILLNIIK